MHGLHLAVALFGLGLCGRPAAGLWSAVAHPDPLDLPERTVSDLWIKLDAIDAELYLRSDAILRHAFEAGFAEPVGSPVGGGCALGMELVREREECFRRETILATRTVGGRDLCVVLERSDFPELYVLKDQSVRLRGLIEGEIRRMARRR